MTAVEGEDESVVVDVSIEEVEDQIDVAVVAGFAAEAVGEDEAEQAQGIEPGMATAPPMRRLAAIWSLMARVRARFRDGLESCRCELVATYRRT